MTGLPNTFQVYNVYIDRAMELLTDSEFRVLMYAARHILGWQDKVSEHRGHISLTMFQRGFTTKTGQHYGGCGIGRSTIIKALSELVHFGLLKREGEPDTRGQKYTIQTSGIDWKGLESRRKDHNDSAKQQTVKATEKRTTGTLNVTGQGGTLNDTMLGTLNDTMQGNAERTESNSLSNPSSKPSLSPVGDMERKRNPWYDAVFEIWKYTAALNTVMAQMLQGKAKQKGYQEFNLTVPITPEQLLTWGAWYRATELKGNTALSMLAEPIKVQSSITQWQSLGMPSATSSKSVLDGLRLVS